MIRGLLSGVAWGALVAGIGISGLSLATPLVMPFAIASDEGRAVTPAPSIVQAPELPQVTPDAAPQITPSTPAPVDVSEAAPVPKSPEVGGEQVTSPARDVKMAAVEPAEPVDAPEAVIQFNQPALPQVSALPGTDAVVVAPSVAAPSVPATNDTNTLATPRLDTQSAALPASVATLPQVRVPGENALPQVSQAIDAEAPPPSFQPAPLAGAPMTTPQVEIAALDTTPAAPQPAQPDVGEDAPPTPQVTVVIPRIAPAAEPAQVDTSPTPQTALVTPRILELGQAAPGTAVGRITLQGGLVTDTQREAAQAALAQTDIAQTTMAETPVADAAVEQIGALDAHAIPFTRFSPDLPVMSIILIDTPASRLDRVTLLGFALPVTFAVDATQPDAAEAVRSYRANGFEVVLLAGGLPPEGTAQDLEHAFEGAVSVVDEAVAVLDTPDGFLSNTRVALDTVLGRLQDSGHGLVTLPQGLNAAEAAARRAGVPGLTAYRMLDAEQEQSAVIARYLDRATFTAGQEGHVVVVGHSYADTVTALYSWQQSNRAQSVQVAPVSYLLREFGQ